MKKNKILTTEYTISSPKIPKEFNGFTIAHISDCHSMPGEGLLEAVAAIKPEITVITGDMLHDIRRLTKGFEVFLENLAKISPVYMVSGNHDIKNPDYKKILGQFSKAELIDNKQTFLEKNGERISLSAIGDPISKIRTDIRKNIKKYYSDLPRFEGFEILLFHRANLFDEVKDYGYDLILSGHMHGGQFHLPYMGGVLAPFSGLPGGYRMIFPKYCYGKFVYKNTTMLINAGSSNTLPIPRWGNPYEVGKITLKNSV